MKLWSAGLWTAGFSRHNGPPALAGNADVSSAPKLLLLCIVLSFNLQCSTHHQVNKEKLQQEVREEFLHSWNSYKKYAWGHDELKPLSKGYRDWHAASLYMTPVDALDTMYLMGLT